MGKAPRCEAFHPKPGLSETFPGPDFYPYLDKFGLRIILLEKVLHKIDLEIKLSVFQTFPKQAQGFMSSVQVF